jgi:multidrug resistance efflux pump
VPASATTATAVTTAAPTTPPATEPAQEAEKFDAEYVKALRKEAADARTKLRAAEAKVTEHETAKLTETERATKRIAELERAQSDWETERQEMRTRDAVSKAAAKLGLDSDLATELVKHSMLEHDPDGKPNNVEDVLKALLKRWPQLAKPAVPQADINAGHGRGDASAAKDIKLQEKELRERFRF